MATRIPFEGMLVTFGGHDGEADSLVHTRCDEPSPWWRLQLGGPSMVAQLALYNRKSYRYRLVGATIVARPVGGAAGRPAAGRGHAVRRARGGAERCDEIRHAHP